MQLGAGKRRGRRWAARLLFATAIAGVLAYLPYQVSGGAGARKLSAIRDDLSETREEIRKVREENAALRRDVAALKEDPRAVEDIARDDLGMVFPKEIVIRLERNEP